MKVSTDHFKSFGESFAHAVGLIPTLVSIYLSASVLVPIVFTIEPKKGLDRCDTYLSYALLSWFLLQWLAFWFVFIVFVMGSEPEPWVQDLIQQAGSAL